MSFYSQADFLGPDFIVIPNDEAQAFRDAHVPGLEQRAAANWDWRDSHLTHGHWVVSTARWGPFFECAKKFAARVEFTSVPALALRLWHAGITDKQLTRHSEGAIEIAVAAPPDRQLDMFIIALEAGVTYNGPTRQT